MVISTVFREGTTQSVKCINALYTGGRRYSLGIQLTAEAVFYCRDDSERRGGLTTHPNNSIDVAAAYPNGQVLLNISHETTFREVSQIQGLDLAMRRKIGINITGGRTNALEFCRDVYKTPTLETMLAAYMEEKNLQQAA